MALAYAPVVHSEWSAAIAAAHRELDRIFDLCTTGDHYYGEGGVKLCLHRRGTADEPFPFRTPPDDRPGPPQACRSESPANQAIRRRAHAELDRHVLRAAHISAMRSLIRVGVKFQDDTAQAVAAVLVPSED